MQKNKKRSLKVYLLVTVLLSMVSEALWSQQDAQYTQYMYNTISVNPGYAGSRGQMSIGLLHRSQWLGLDGAPVTQTFNFHTPIGYKGVGLGFSVVNDKIGPTSETYFDGDFSYTLKTSREGKLSFGLKASAHLLDVRFSELNQDSNGGSDPTLQADINNRLSPNIGAGVYYHTQRFYLGLSVPRFLQTSHFDSSSQSTAQEQMNFYLITGYVFDLNPTLKFKPTLLTKGVKGAPLQVDASLNFMLNERFIIGGAYRWSAAFSGMVGFHITEGLMIGMAYDKETTELGSAVFNDGSFEVLLRYDFIDNKDNLRSPRFF